MRRRSQKRRQTRRALSAIIVARIRCGVHSVLFSDPGFKEGAGREGGARAWERGNEIQTETGTERKRDREKEIAREREIERKEEVVGWVCVGGGHPSSPRLAASLISVNT